MLVHGEETRNMQPLEFLGNLILLIVGGNDTTRNSISGGVLALNENPNIANFLTGGARLENPIKYYQEPLGTEYENGMCPSETKPVGDGSCVTPDGKKCALRGNTKPTFLPRCYCPTGLEKYGDGSACENDDGTRTASADVSDLITLYTNIPMGTNGWYALLGGHLATVTTTETLADN